MDDGGITCTPNLDVKTENAIAEALTESMQSAEFTFDEAAAKKKKRQIELLLDASKVPYGTRKLGRNDICSCGSGMKYKKCCLIRNRRA